MSSRLAEVAKKVGVSEATVSRVLNGKPGVSESTRQAVLAALDVLGYERPSKLRGERARLVGLFLPELTNPIFPAFGELVGGGLVQQGYTPVLCTQTAGGISEADYIELLLEQRVSGVVFVGGQYTQADAPHEHYERLADLGIPTVLVNARVAELEFPTVSTDDQVAVELGWNHLRQLGHERIGLVLGPLDHVPSQRKLEAAKRLAAAEGGELDAEPRRPLPLQPRGRAGRRRPPHPRRRHRHPVRLRPARARCHPRRAPCRARTCRGDVSIVGYDDSALMNAIDPPLTTVRQPIEPMGRLVIELLVAQLQGTSPAHGGVPLRAGARGARVDGACVRADRPSRRPTALASRSATTSRKDWQVSCTLFSSCVNLSGFIHSGCRRRLGRRERPEEEPRVDADVLPITEPAPATEPAATSRCPPSTTRTGGAPPSSTRSTRAPSRTATATARATSPACAAASATCATSASTRSGSPPGTRARSPTAATTSATTAPSTPTSAPSPRPSC